MSEEALMEEQKSSKIRTIYNNIPYFLVEDELTHYDKSTYDKEMDEIGSLYEQYKIGEDFITEGANGDYVPSDLKYKKASSIINKEARFMFANPPSFNINIDDVNSANKDSNTIIQDFLDNVLEKNNFSSNLMKSAKDCFVGKRIAILLNFNDEGISITFFNSMEFLYETTGKGVGDLKSIVVFYNTVKSAMKTEQRWFKKKYTLEKGVVYVSEVIYDGLGKELEVPVKKMKTKFTKIPAVVILNEGLIGEIFGESEFKELLEDGSAYNRLSNGDIDSQRKNMNPIKYAIDASLGSTKALSTSPGSFWDIQSDEEKAVERAAQVGILESSMAYSQALKTTLDRLENNMYSKLDVPNINSEQLSGVITSGKTIKALYWGLKVRCDEKFLIWCSALKYIAECIIEGGKLYPKSISKYVNATILPDITFDLLVENNYPLPEDIEEEKNMDITEIDANVMSRKTYLKKWRKLSDKEADEELMQIKFENDLFENSQLPDVSEDDVVDFEEDGDVIDEQ